MLPPTTTYRYNISKQMMDSKAYPENAPPTNTYQQPPGSSGNMATPNMYGQPPPYEQACYSSPNQPYPYPQRQGNIKIDDIFIIGDRFAKKCVDIG